MKEVFGIIFLTLGVIMLAIAGIGAPNVPNISELVGTFLPGILCLILGLKLRKNQQENFGPGGLGFLEIDSSGNLSPGSSVVSMDATRIDSFYFHALLGMIFGISIMLFGSAWARVAENFFFYGVLTSFLGFAWLLWGCVNFMRWKGYSGWFGFIGYFFLPGLLVLCCFPNRRKRLLQKSEEGQTADMVLMAEYDRRPGYRFLLVLVPWCCLAIAVGAMFNHFSSNIDASEWKEVAQAGIGFKVNMPGIPTIDEKVQEADGGKVEIRKFSVVPKGKKELFLIVSVRLTGQLSKKFEGPQELLEIGRQDLLNAVQGELKSEKEIAVGGWLGREIEVLPPQGAIVKARVFATNNQVCYASAHVPKFRVNSEDIKRFLDSFKIIEP